MTGAVLMLSIAYGAPPEYAKTPPIGHTMLWSVLRTERTGPTRSGVVRVEDRGEARDAALDDLLVHDVGLVDAVLRVRSVRVVDLHRDRAAA